MDAQEKIQLREIIIEEMKSNRGSIDHATGYLRYEALRKLNASQYAELCQRNLNGERFDDMVDNLIITNNKDK